MCKTTEFNENVENKLSEEFAKKLASDLEGAGFEEGLEILDDVFDGVSYGDCDVEELEEYYGYRFRYECGIKTDQMHDMEDEDENVYGIYMVYYKFEVNPTQEEMIDFLLETGEFEEGFEEELDEDGLYREFDEELSQKVWALEFDSLEGMFDDMRVLWDVLIDEECHYYRGSDGVLYQY